MNPQSLTLDSISILLNTHDYKWCSELVFIIDFAEYLKYLKDNSSAIDLEINKTRLLPERWLAYIKGNNFMNRYKFNMLR